MDADPQTTPDAGTAADVAVTPPDAAPSSGGAPPAALRPDAMGQACKNAENEAFTVSAFEVQAGVITAQFTATPQSRPPTVVSLSDSDVGPGWRHAHAQRPPDPTPLCRLRHA